MPASAAIFTASSGDVAAVMEFLSSGFVVMAFKRSSKADIAQTGRIYTKILATVGRAHHIRWASNKNPTVGVPFIKRSKTSAFRPCSKQKELEGAAGGICWSGWGRKVGNF